MRTSLAVGLLAASLFISACSHPQAPPATPPAMAAPVAAPAAAPTAASNAAPVAPADRGWIERSNQNAQLLLGVIAQFQPEQAARQGITGLDDRITDFTPGHQQRQRDAIRQAQTELEHRLAGERDPLVAQDLQILIDAARRQSRGIELHDQLEVPYRNVPQIVFGGIRSLLDPQIAADRRPAALVRLRKYLGMDGGASVVQLLEAETRDGFKHGRLPPPRLAVENDLDTAEPAIAGIDKLFKEFNIAGAEPALAELHKQLAAYLAFVRGEVLPKARGDFRLPPELYAFSLQQVGVDIAPDELARRAHQAFAEIQGEMQVTAQKLAQQRGWAKTDYRDVIKELKKAQIPDDQVLEFYKRRLAQIEDIIRAQHLVTLPDRPARIRLGSPAENAQQPAPHMQPPRLIGNTGEQGEFVLPLSVPGKTTQKYDDFNFDAASWTLIAHEARPGHELQFSRMVETGVSLARAIFAFNSVNAEGWGLYAEAITLPYMPLDGQLISLQLRLQRAARAFLDPELQIPGKWTPETARAFLQKEVGLSPAFATEEVDRFTFRSPAQATAYFYGYTRLLELRDAAQAQLGARFDRRAFHDLFLAQGLLPPDLMRKAVLAALR
ncbi:MAG TPA: DUF885 domain-containing protein [Kofleriaceae bacterium]|jgi:hypothetical protein|nr:DUF885 domain-containing protein [Kofleriaceae bacterium]